MKKFLSVFLALALFAGVASAATHMVLEDTVGTVVLAANGSTEWYAIGNVDTVRVQVWSATTSDCVVTIEITSDSASALHIFPAAQFDDPDSVGEYWSIPQSGFVRVTVSSWASGDVSANLEGYRGKEKVW